MRWLGGFACITRGKICRVSRQLLTGIGCLRSDEEHIGCLLQIAARLSSSVGGQLTFVKPFNDLQFLAGLPVFDHLPLALLAQAFDNLACHLYTPLAQGRGYDLKLDFGSGHSSPQALRQRPGFLEAALLQGGELLLGES